MFGLGELKQTKVYQEAFEEGEMNNKLTAIPRMMRLGLSLEIIAKSLDLPIDTVREKARKYRSNPESDSRTRYLSRAR